MSDLRQLGKEFLYEFIELYKSFSCLWQVKSKQYSDRHLKDKAYQKLIKKYKEVDKNADRDTIVRKINSLRSCYRKEVKKIETSVHNGAKDEDVYKPNLWYFKQLTFLRESTTDVDVMPENQSQDPLDRSISPCPSSGSLISEATDSEINIKNIRQTPSISRRSAYKRKSEDCIDNVLQLIGKRLSSTRTDDHLDYAAKNWIATLRSVPKEQQIYAVRVIGDVMCEAQLENLNRNTRLALCEHKQPHFQCQKWEPCPQQFSTEMSNLNTYNTFSIKQLPTSPSLTNTTDLTSLNIHDGL